MKSCGYKKWRGASFYWTSHVGTSAYYFLHGFIHAFETEVRSNINLPPFLKGRYARIRYSAYGLFYSLDMHEYLSTYHKFSLMDVFILGGPCGRGHVDRPTGSPTATQQSIEGAHKTAGPTFRPCIPANDRASRIPGFRYCGHTDKLSQLSI